MNSDKPKRFARRVVWSRPESAVRTNPSASLRGALLSAEAPSGEGGWDEAIHAPAQGKLDRVVRNDVDGALIQISNIQIHVGWRANLAPELPCADLTMHYGPARPHLATQPESLA